MAGRKRTVSNGEIAREFYLSPDPAFISAEIAEHVEMSRQGLLSRLDEMEEKGLLQSKIPGRDRIFWLTEDGEKLAIETIQSN